MIQIPGLMYLHKKLKIIFYISRPRNYHCAVNCFKPHTPLIAVAHSLATLLVIIATLN